MLLLLAASASLVAMGPALTTPAPSTGWFNLPVRPLLALEQDTREGRDEGRGESATVPSATAAVAEAVKVWAKDVGITEAQRASAVTYKTTGEDAAAFSWEAQQGIQWIRFVAAVSTVRGALFICIFILILIFYNANSHH